MTRQEANNAIMSILQSTINDYPDWRFGQILSNLGIATHRAHTTITDEDEETDYQDIFFEESMETLDKLAPQIEILPPLKEKTTIYYNDIRTKHP